MTRIRNPYLIARMARYDYGAPLRLIGNGLDDIIQRTPNHDSAARNDRYARALERYRTPDHDSRVTRGKVFQRMWATLSAWRASRSGAGA